MRFLQRNKFALLFLALLTTSSVLALRQFQANQTAHVELREDFILLHEQNETQSAGRLYQMLIQQLPRLSDADLVNDLQRLSLLRGTNPPSDHDLLWKLQVSANNELQKRARARIERARARAAAP